MKQVSINVPDEMDAEWVFYTVNDMLSGIWPDDAHELIGLEATMSGDLAEVVANTPVEWGAEIYVGEVLLLRQDKSTEWQYIECFAWDQEGCVVLVKYAAAKRATSENRPFGWRVCKMVNGVVVSYYDHLDEERSK